jgi:hypothetical protein
MYLMKQGVTMDLIHMNQNMIWCRALVSTVMNIEYQRCDQLSNYQFLKKNSAV